MGFSAGFSGFKAGYETLNNFSTKCKSSFRKKKEVHTHTYTHTRARARTHTSDKADAF
jgi:hypothetical protein